MSFWDTVDEDPLTELLSNKDSPLSSILDEETMLQELRTGNVDLVSYLSQERVIKELCEWSMTMKFESNPNFNRFTRLTTEALTCGEKFPQVLLGSTSIQEFFSEYLTSANEWDAICTGHFQRVFVNLIKASNGKFLEKFPNIEENLDAHLSILAVAEFVIQLATEFGDFLPKQFVPILVKYIDSQTSNDLFPAIYALRQIFEIAWENVKIQESFTNEEVIASMIHAAKNTKDKLASIELYRLLSRIKEKSTMAAGLILKHSNEFAHPDGAVTDAPTAFSADELDPKTAASILCNDTHWALANKLCAKLASISKEELVNAVTSSGLLQKITENSQNSCLTSQQIQVINLLAKAGVELSISRNDIDKALLLGVRYGGEVPIGFQEGRKLNAE